MILTPDAEPAPPDLAVEALKKARRRPAVLKLEIAKLRSAAPKLPILAFEGDDDKIVYHHWISKLRPDFNYASFPCGGKGKVLQLRESLKRDLTGLKNGIYFFVDRDFDDLRGQEQGPDIFMTEFYAVENYLVTQLVLDKVLELEFHCHGTPNVRRDICRHFERSYKEFLEVTRDMNRRLYVARRHKIEVKSITDKISDIADISMASTLPGRLTSVEVIQYLGDLEGADLERFEKEFDELDPETRYRGKFALMFFSRWLQHLASQASQADRGVFRESNSNAPFRLGELGLNCFASRSHLPRELGAFIDAIVVS